MLFQHTMNRIDNSKEALLWEMEMGGCDEEFCNQCNPQRASAISIVAKINDNINNGVARKYFLQLIENSKDFIIKGVYKFTFKKYIRNGYNVHDEKSYDIRFINNDFSGYLYHKKSNVINIYHKGTQESFETNGEFPKLCRYDFTTEDSDDGDLEPDSKSFDHVKIVMEDTIFEDYVHEGFGFILDNEQIKKCHKEDQIVNTSNGWKVQSRKKHLKR